MQARRDAALAALNQHYATDVEDFWSAPWGHTDVVVFQPARDNYRYGGVRVSAGF